MWRKTYIYRASFLAASFPAVLRPSMCAFIEALDRLSPGWKRARVTQIVGAQDATGSWMDNVYELPGNISVRGWDMTGAIYRT